MSDSARSSVPDNTLPAGEEDNETRGHNAPSPGESLAAELEELALQAPLQDPRSISAVANLENRVAAMALRRAIAVTESQAEEGNQEVAEARPAEEGDVGGEAGGERADQAGDGRDERVGSKKGRGRSGGERAESSRSGRRKGVANAELGRMARFAHLRRKKKKIKKEK
ncbi:hypothetical protein BCV69DRAFT_298939 [Microstroma glucosiphilum]|uniref:Uncharacterized protein n=1 Tax=Pseudomicrostroma glucosiphilum TaxID=1684307 RepID=A0A316U7J8_9BASI|nr:hypothetical protein BCV69DRAFT_298939 [Pseudomicrostroma glucosiphilum]PWN21162.1 hypothetical protein BCV69DRAFT_298939 [Pseudomicrostroma glucosiphilum]